MSATPVLIPPFTGGPGRPNGRFPFAFGRRFFLLLLIGLVWIGPAWLDSRYLYGMVLWDAIMATAWIADLSRLPQPEQIEARRIWVQPVQLSVPCSVTVEVRNRGAVSVSTQLFDDAPAALRSEVPHLELFLAPGETRRLTYFLRPNERGDASMGDLFVRCQSAWGLAERWISVAARQTVRVYPNLEESKRDTIFLIRSRQVALEKRHKHQPGHGREFESLREYREGDEWRDICWSAAARRGKLISKSYQTERSQTVWLVLDTGRLLRARVLGLSKLDYAVNAALALAQVALYSGDQVALLVYGRRVQQRLPGARGANHLRALVEALAQARGNELEADHLLAAQALLTLQKRRSLVVWFTDLAETASTPEVIEGASILARRHLVLFVVIGQPELRRLLEERPEDQHEMYRYAAAQEIVHRRDALLGSLRRQGVLTLEIEPARLSPAVVNQYLMVKERSLI